MTFNPLSVSLTKWSNTLKQFVGNLSMNCLSVFDHFVKLALKGLMPIIFKVKLRTVRQSRLSDSGIIPLDPECK